MWIFWLFLANFAIMWLEFTYRAGTYNSFFAALPYTIVPILLGQIGLYYAFRLAPSLLVAGASFTLINVALRVINTYRLGEVINGYNWLGIAFLIVSMFLLKVK